MYLDFHSQVYDSFESITALQANVTDLLKKSEHLLSVLSSSGAMVEGLVRSHFKEMQVQYGERFGSALTDLDHRLRMIEESIHGKKSLNSEDIPMASRSNSVSSIQTPDSASLTSTTTNTTNTNTPTTAVDTTFSMNAQIPVRNPHGQEETLVAPKKSSSPQMYHSPSEKNTESKDMTNNNTSNGRGSVSQ